MMSDRWAFPGRLAVIFAVLIGVWSGMGTAAAHDYAGYHLYYTLAGTLAVSIGSFVPALLVSFYCVWFALRTAPRLGGISGAVFLAAAAAGSAANLLVLSGNHYVLVSGVSAFVPAGLRSILTDSPGSLHGILGLDALGAHELFLAYSIVLLVFSAVFLLLPRMAGRRRGKRVAGEGSNAVFSVGASRRDPIWHRVFGYVGGVFLLFPALLGLCTIVLWGRNSLFVGKSPNVVLIIVDTLRADHLGCYGYGRDTTPNIDDLAEQSVRFERAIAQASWTRPSICSMVTSRYPETMDLGDPHPPRVLSSNFLTMAEVFREHGYYASGVVSNLNINANVNFDQGFDFFEDSAEALDLSSPSVSSEAIRQLSRLKSERFFMLVHFMDPHMPYIPHEEYNFYPDYRGNLPTPVRLWHDEPKVQKQEDVEYAKAVYDSDIRYTDEYVGRFLRALKDAGVFDNTIVILVADHGDEFREHGRFSHAQSLYDELIRVPCLIKLPQQKTGRVVKGTFPLVDMLPSVLEHIGVSTAGYRFHGSPADLTADSLPDRFVYSTQIIHEVGFDPIALRSVENSRYKFIKSFIAPGEELFDLPRDPGEQTNVLSFEPVVSAEMRKRVLQHKDRMDAAAAGVRGGFAAPQTKEDIERLKSLGYLQ